MRKISTAEKCKRAVASLYDKCLNRILGRKFYIVVVGQRGAGLYFVNQTIYRSLQQVEQYRESLKDNKSFMYIGTYHFRSRNDFILTIANTSSTING